MKKYYKIIMIVLISLACEIFLFNYNFFITLFNKEITYSNNELNYSFEIKDINKKVKNIKIELMAVNYCLLNISVTDEGNKNYVSFKEKKVSPNNIRSLYQNTHPSGKVKDMKLSCPGGVVRSVTLNAKVPLMFSFIRFLIILLVVSFVYIFNSKSKLYNIRLFENKSNKMIIFEIIVLLCIGLGCLCVNNEYFLNTTYANQHQYDVLTDSIKEGKLYVEELKDSFLLDMDNPYDTTERYKLSNENGQTFLWDYAYYKGKYYVYFGIGPVLLTYLPYNLLTGKYINNTLVDLLFIVFSLFSTTYLLYMICKKWFKDIKLLTFLMCMFLLITSSGIFYVAKRPDFYNVPIITALFFTTLGLGLFISASMDKKLFKTKLFIASSCMAFVALCRPQFLITSFLIVPLYYDYFFKKIDKQKLKELLCIVIPYVIFAVLTCAYNYARFGNIFDFGASYNLTSNDMTHRGFILARIPLGIFAYLLMPFRVSAVFPFIEIIPELTNNYLGKTIYEASTSGFMYSHIITVVSLFIFKLKSYFKDKKLYIISIMSIIFAFVVIIFDTEMAGILPRYLMDFSYLLLIPTIIIVFSLENKILENKMLKKVFIISIFLAVIYEFLILFVDYGPSIEENMTDIFYYFRYLFML